MQYSLIAATLFSAVFAMPAAPASYGEAPASYGNAPDSYGSGSEQVYGTQVANVQSTTAAALPSSTCTEEEAEKTAVPYTAVAQSQVAESSVSSIVASSTSAVPAMMTSASEASPDMSAETPAGYASASTPKDVASASENSPAETQPAGYAMSSSTPKDVASASDVSPVSSPAAASVSSPAAAASSPSSEESSPEMPADQQYGSAMVPGSAPTAAPYPVAGEGEASPAMGSAGLANMAPTGTAGVAMPTGTGSVSGTPEFEGAASHFTAAGMFVSFGAVVALFM